MRVSPQNFPSLFRSGLGALGTHWDCIEEQYALRTFPSARVGCWSFSFSRSLASRTWFLVTIATTASRGGPSMMNPVARGLVPQNQGCNSQLRPFPLATESIWVITMAPGRLLFVLGWGHQKRSTKVPISPETCQNHVLRSWTQPWAYTCLGSLPPSGDSKGKPSHWHKKCNCQPTCVSRLQGV